MIRRPASLDERERRAVMGLVDARLAIDRFDKELADVAPELNGEVEKRRSEAQLRLDAMLIQNAVLPDQADRITKMADVQYRVIKALEPFDAKDRERILAKLRRDFLENGASSSREALIHGRDVLSKEIEDKEVLLNASRKVQAEMQAEYDARKHVVDVVNLRKERPRYVRQLEWTEKTWGAVPPRDWVGTERHKALVAGIDPALSVDRFVTEITVEVLTHLAWEAVKEDPKLRHEMLHETIPMMAATLDWTRAGCPVFSLTDDFFHALAVTDFGTSEDDKDDVLHMPFPAFIVNFPPNALLDDARRMFVYRVAESKPGTQTTPEPAKVDGEVIVHAEMETIWPLTRIALMGDPARFSQWPSSITRWEFLKARDRGRASSYAEAVDAKDVELVGMARRILANMLSYIESNHGLPTQKHKHGAEAAPVEREHSEPRFRVGRTVRLAPQIRALLREGRTGQSWKLGHRFIVRGHFRMQVHGPQRALRRRQWIEPFWRGPQTLDEAFERTYSVE